MRLNIFEVFDEQALVSFTGRLNILHSSNNKYEGEIIFLEGDIINAKYKQITGFKALMKLCVLMGNNEDQYKSVIEPELISVKDKRIELSLGNLKRKIMDFYDKYMEMEKFRPPGNMKLLPRADVLESKIDITPQEYSLLCTLSDYNLVEDIYNNNEMLDFEITQALVTLRKKEVIKVIKLV